MDAYRAERLSGIGALARMDIATPEPGPEQIRIAVRAAGLHLADAAALSGQRQPRLPPPLVPGFEVSGTVSALGAAVRGIEPGQRVVAFLGSGGLASEVLAEAGLAVPLPEGLTFARAAGLPLAYAGGLMALRDRAGLRAGETLLVLGAGGQAGLAAIELAKQLGARVIAAAGRAERLEAAASHGADETIDAAARPLGEAVLELTDGRGADVVFDPVGGEGTRAALPALAEGARLVCAGFAAGRVQPVAARAIYARDASLLSANVPLMIARDPDRARAALADVIAWTASGDIRPRIAAQFPFEQVPQAFDYIASRRDSGAVVVMVGG